jgi:hypothetical protein
VVEAAVVALVVAVAELVVDDPGDHPAALERGRFES